MDTKNSVPPAAGAARLEDGGQAFPRAGHEGESYHGGSVPGMSLRDYFAAKIAAGEFAAEEEGVHEKYFTLVAERAYKMADAMLAARGRSA